MQPKFLSVLILLGFSCTLLVFAAPEDPRPKVVVVGQIARVDNPAKSFELKSQQEVNNQHDALDNLDSVTIGGTIGKRAPAPGSVGPGSPSIEGPGRTFPGNTPISRPTTGTDPDRRPPATIRTTVFLSDSTICKDRTKVFLCGELKLKDRLQVSGDEKTGPRGPGIYATEIIRTR